MNNKINILFDQIHLDQEIRNNLSEMVLEKVKVNEKNGSWTFVLKNPTILDCSDYQILEDLSIKTFSNIKHIFIQIVPEK